MPLKLSPTQSAFNARGDGTFNKPFAEQVEFLRQKIDLPTEHYDDILKDAHDRAFMVAGAAKADLLADLHGAISQVAAEGKSIQWFRKNFFGIVQKHGWEGWTGSDTKAGRDWRTRVIYNTNLSASYAAGRYAQLTHPDLLKSRPYWKYVHSDTVQTPRPLHQSWSGMVLKYDDPFWQTHFPPNGWGCQCRIVPVSADKYTGQQAPDDGTYKKVDRNGEVHTIPEGIDYGWDYTPGASVKDQLQQFIAAKAKALPEPLAAALLAETQAPIPAMPPDSGMAVSDALIMPKGGIAKKAANNVLPEIDKLHSVDKLPVIPIKSSASLTKQGEYSYYERTGEPIELKVTKASVNPDLTLAHEIGHFIDHQGIGTAGKYSSTYDPLFADWRAAVDKSLATDALTQLSKSPSLPYSSRRLASYYLSNHEQWARSYAQWVATRSGNANLKGQVNAITANGHNVYSASQWSDDDFLPIGQAIDALFTKMGWLK